MDNEVRTKPNLKKRIIATAIDYGLIFLITYAYILYFGELNDEGGQSVNGLKTLPIIGLWFFYFVVTETIYSATLGHQLLDLKVLKKNGGRVEFTNALKRHLLDPIDIFFYGIPGIIAIKKTEKNQRLGDLWANTIMVDLKDKEQGCQTDDRAKTNIMTTEKPASS